MDKNSEPLSVMMPSLKECSVCAHRVEHAETGERFLWQWLPNAVLWVSHEGELLSPSRAAMKYRYVNAEAALRPFEISEESRRAYSQEIRFWRHRCDEVIDENRRLKKRMEAGGARPDLGSLAHMTETLSALVRSHHADLNSAFKEIANLHTLLMHLDPTGGLIPSYVEDGFGGRRLAVPIHCLVQNFWDKRAFSEADPNHEDFFDTPARPSEPTPAADAKGDPADGTKFEVDWLSYKIAHQEIGVGEHPPADAKGDPEVDCRAGQDLPHCAYRDFETPRSNAACPGPGQQALLDSGHNHGFSTPIPDGDLVPLVDLLKPTSMPCVETKIVSLDAVIGPPGDPPLPNAESHPNVFGNPSAGTMTPWEAVESIAKGGV